MNKSRGTVLLYSILVIGALLFFAILYINLFMSGSDIGKRADQDAEARAAAAAGIDDAFHQLNASSSWSPANYQQSLQSRNASYEISFNSGQSQIPYSTNNISGSKAVTAYDSRTVPVGTAYIVSVGTSNGSTYVEHAFVEKGGSSFFNEGLFSQNGKIKIEGGSVVGYVPPYPPSQNEPCLSQTLVGTDNGTIIVGSNGQSNEGTVVNGDITAYSGDPNNPSAITDNSPNPVCSNSPNSGVSYTSLPTIKAPTCPGNLTAISSTSSPVPGCYSGISLQSGHIATLTSGTYVITGNISLNGQAQLVLEANSGPVTIFAEGKIDLEGQSVVNPSKQDANLVIYDVAPSSDSVQIGGGTQAYMQLYSENASVSVTGVGGPATTTVQGSIVSAQGGITVNGNVNIYYDTALESKQNGNGGTANMQFISRW